VAVINKDPARSSTVRPAIPGAGGSGTLQRLIAPGISARSGVTLGGQSVGRTSGQLTGPATHDAITAVDGRYAISMPAGSAALLDLPR
jgi:hypothetical protein